MITTKQARKFYIEQGVRGLMLRRCVKRFMQEQAEMPIMRSPNKIFDEHTRKLNNFSRFLNGGILVPE